MLLVVWVRQNRAHHRGTHPSGFSSVVDPSVVPPSAALPTSSVFLPLSWVVSALMVLALLLMDRPLGVLALDVPALDVLALVAFPHTAREVVLHLASEGRLLVEEGVLQIEVGG